MQLDKAGNSDSLKKKYLLAEVVIQVAKKRQKRVLVKSKMYSRLVEEKVTKTSQNDKRRKLWVRFLRLFGISTQIKISISRELLLSE